MDPLYSTWSIERIVASSFSRSGDKARVEASNWAGDNCTLVLGWIPAGRPPVLDFFLDSSSANWWEHYVASDVEAQVASDALRILKEWEKENQRIVQLVPHGQWAKGPNNDYQFEYAVFALLRERLGEFGGLRTNEEISIRLDIPASTAKERVRECRARGLLTEPGKGIRGKGSLTAKARRILIEKGVISA